MKEIKVCSRCRKSSEQIKGLFREVISKKDALGNLLSYLPYGPELYELEGVLCEPCRKDLQETIEKWTRDVKPNTLTVRLT